MAAFERFTSSSLYHRIYRLFDNPVVFNAYQVLVDGGKGRRIRRFLEDVRYATVVDIGCGTGNWAITARGRYLGVDVSREFVESARERYANDKSKQFIELDPTTEALPGEYDLAQLVSVLHHMSDKQVLALLDRIVPRTRYLFILDLYPISWNPIARFLYAADRGDFIREPTEQKRLIQQRPDLRLVREDDYFAPTGVYRHTLMLFENKEHA